MFAEFIDQHASRNFIDLSKVADWNLWDSQINSYARYMRFKNANAVVVQDSKEQHEAMDVVSDNGAAFGDISVVAEQKLEEELDGGVHEVQATDPSPPQQHHVHSDSRSSRPSRAQGTAHSNADPVPEHSERKRAEPEEISPPPFGRIKTLCFTYFIESSEMVIAVHFSISSNC